MILPFRRDKSLPTLGLYGTFARVLGILIFALHSIYLPIHLGSEHHHPRSAHEVGDSGDEESGHHEHEAQHHHGEDHTTLDHAFDLTRNSNQSITIAIDVALPLIAIVITPTITETLPSTYPPDHKITVGESPPGPQQPGAPPCISSLI